MQHSISVIIPAYNASDTIEKAITTIESQTYKPLEVVVVNDGSSDGTADVVKNLSTNLNVVLVTIENSGPSKARNTGIDRAKGKWLAFLDADDIWTNDNKLKLQIDKAVEEDDTVLVDTFADVFFHEKAVRKTIKKDNSTSSVDDLLVFNVINATSSVLVKKSAIQQAGGFNEDLKYGEDRLLWARLSMIGSFKTVTEVCVYKENHAMNLTSKGIDNIEHRMRLVDELVSLVDAPSISLSKLWFKNLTTWFADALRTKSPKYFMAVAEVAKRNCPLRFYFSPFVLVYIWFQISKKGEKQSAS